MSAGCDCYLTTVQKGAELMDDESVPYGLYTCDQCGACCKGTVIVEADYLDARREPRLILLQVGLCRVTPRGLEDDGKIVLLACGLDKPCRFLDAENRCTIYPTRPNVCVAFDAGSQQCQEARARLGIARLLPVLQQPSQEATP
jgi:Fe-S-cluster containining protein